jgi:hypothetical protein
MRKTTALIAAAGIFLAANTASAATWKLVVTQPNEATTVAPYQAKAACVQAMNMLAGKADAAGNPVATPQGWKPQVSTFCIKDANPPVTVTPEID